MLRPTVERVVLLESKMEELEKLPWYKIHPDDPTRQKVLPCYKMYKEMLQQYANLIKILAKAAGIDESEEDSPLRVWLEARLDKC